MNKNFWNTPLRNHHRLSDQIRSIVSPILEAFDLSQFCYFFVTPHGYSACLSSHPAWAEFYLTNGLFQHNPFLKSTELLPEGVFLSEHIREKGFLESKREAQKFGIGDSLTIAVKTQGKLEGFSFSTKTSHSNTTLLINELPLLKQFCTQFQDRTKKTLLDLASEPVYLPSLLDSRMHKPFLASSKLTQQKRAQLLSKLKWPDIQLTPREKECLLLSLEGETARSIAYLLDLSPRTIEDYLENAKDKMCCSDKSSLLKKAKMLQDLGLLSPYFLRLGK